MVSGARLQQWKLLLEAGASRNSRRYLPSRSNTLNKSSMSSVCFRNRVIVKFCCSFPMLIAIRMKLGRQTGFWSTILSVVQTYFSSVGWWTKRLVWVVSVVSPQETDSTMKPETAEAVMTVKAAMEPSSTAPIPPVLRSLVYSKFLQKEPREAEAEDRTGSTTCHWDKFFLTVEISKINNLSLNKGELDVCA